MALLWIPASPSQSNEASVKDIFLLFNSLPPSWFSFLSFIVSEHPQGSRLSLIYFRLTPLESLQERAQILKCKKTQGDPVSLGLSGSLGFTVNCVPFPNISFSEMSSFFLLDRKQGILQRLTGGTLWILKKQSVSLSSPRGAATNTLKPNLSICSNYQQGYKSPRGERY